MYKYIHNHSVFCFKNSTWKILLRHSIFFSNISLKKKKRKRKVFSLKKTSYFTICINHWFKGTRKPKSSSCLDGRDKLFFSLPSPLYLYFVNYERKLKTPILEKPVGNETRSLLPFVDNASVVTSIVYFLNFSQFFFYLLIFLSPSLEKIRVESDLYTSLYTRKRNIITFGTVT